MTMTMTQYLEIVAEIDNITKHLLTTRNTLWEAQDKLKASEEMVKEYESNISELLFLHKNESSQIDQLRKANSQFLEQEAELRESLRSMKKAFAKSQMQLKEDKETIQLLEEERDLVVEENDAIRKASIQGKADHEILSKIHHESTARELFLTQVLEQTSMELQEHQKKLTDSENAIQSLTKQLYSNSENGIEPDAHLKIIEQQKQIEILERQLDYKKDKKEGFFLNEEWFDQDVKDGLAQFDKDLKEGLARAIEIGIDWSGINDHVVLEQAK